MEGVVVVGVVGGCGISNVCLVFLYFNHVQPHTLQHQQLLHIDLV